jgi:hypothetical protein
MHKSGKNLVYGTRVLLWDQSGGSRSRYVLVGFENEIVVDIYMKGSLP